MLSLATVTRCIGGSSSCVAHSAHYAAATYYISIHNSMVYITGSKNNILISFNESNNSLDQEW